MIYDVPCGLIDMVIKDLDLDPKIDAMMREFLNLVVLPGGKNYARKRIVRSSQVEMDPAESSKGFFLSATLTSSQNGLTSSLVDPDGVKASEWKLQA
ncbi:hypothetical protein Tco_0727226 [Tanacetum coccineum]|uniref:Uncharacterized protein n=1 Tax=Tanacetum coccineum TaxID=301880 RepID=A0ABQ4YIQ4_9ASTR